MLLIRVKRVHCVLAVAAAMVAAVVASAGISSIALRFEAVNALGSDDFEVGLEELSYNPTTGLYTWGLTFSEDLASSPGNIIATLNSATLVIGDDPANYPRIFINYEVQAGELAVEEFRVQSALVSFSEMLPELAAGRATAGFSITDVVNDGIPAELQGLPSEDVPVGHGIHTAWHNGLYPTGTEFAHLVEFVDANYGGTNTANGKKPASGFLDIGAGLYDISVECGFSLTAGDLMSGNTTWTVTPEPATVGLLLLATVMLVRRR
ncbi:MAG: PEP-CTERM sorting domain-containing protein [Planctomycetota bacterium]